MSSPDSEQELIRKAIAGDRTSTGLLLLEYHARLLEFIHRKSSDFVLQRIGVDEIVSETRLAVYRGIAKFEPLGEGAFWGWLQSVAHHRIVDLFRRESRRREVNVTACGPFRDGENSLVEVFDEWAADTSTASQALRRKEKIEAVRNAIAGLSKDNYRLAMELRFLEQRTYAEIAELMGCTEGALHGYLDRAKKELLRILGRESQHFSSH